MKFALFITVAILATWPFAHIDPHASLAFIGTLLGLTGAAAAAATAGTAGVLGAVAGAIPKHENSSSGLNLKDAGALENSASAGLGGDYASLRAMLEGGAKSGDYSNGVQGQRDYASMLGDYAKTGGLPGQEDLANANIFAQRAYGPQRVALGQSFEDQKIEAARQSASMGRSVDDPILQAKLRTGMMRQSASLQAEQGAFANQFAMSLPQQRLGYAGQQAEVLDQIGQRASSNRQLLMSLGSGILGNERSFRAQTADQWGDKSSGGGLGGAISGFLGGAGGGMQAFTASRGMFGGGASATPSSNYSPAASPFSFTPTQNAWNSSARTTGVMPQ